MKKNPPHLPAEKLAHAKAPVGVKGKMLLHVVMGFFTARVQRLLHLALLVKMPSQTLLRLRLNEPSRLRDNLKPSAINLDFPVPAIAIVLMVRPAAQWVSAPE
jgi:hypothetical protein